MEERYTWDLTGIFKNEEEFDKAKNELNYKLQEIKKYQGRLCESADNLYNCYYLFEKAEELFEKIYPYGMLNYHLDMSNEKSIKLYKSVESIVADFSVAVSFITPEITEANEENIRKYFIEKPELGKYKRDIEEILEKKKHVLSKESEELLSNYTEVFSSTENAYDIFTNSELKYGELVDEDGNKQELTDANYTTFLKSKDRRVRKEAFNLMYDAHKKYIKTFTELYLARVKEYSITSRIRKYNSSLERAVIDDDASIKVYESLMQAVENMMYVNHKFLQLKKNMIGLDTMHMYDIYYNPLDNETEKITFEEAKEEVLNALSVLGEDYVEKLKYAFENRWIDVYEKENKMGGAYNMGVYGAHSYVLLNFIGDKRDTSTIAHELGHAMHSEYTNSNQNIIDSSFTIMVAEVASTVNEILLASYQIKNEPDKAKKAAIIYEMLEMIRATLFRQAMFAEFEKQVHEKIEAGEMLSPEDLNKIHYELNKRYFGDSTEVDEDIKYEWARIPHFYNCFYVYKYATGITCAIAIASKILAGEPGYVEKYKKMLTLGRTKKSIDLLRMVDVDLESTKPYEDAINFYKKNIDELEELLK